MLSGRGTDINIIMMPSRFYKFFQSAEILENMTKAITNGS
jgi:hypothetical protein